MKTLLSLITFALALNAHSLDQNETSSQSAFCNSMDSYMQGFASSNNVSKWGVTVVPGVGEYMNYYPGIISGRSCELIPDSDARVTLKYDYNFTNNYNTTANVKGDIKCVFAADNLQDWDCGFLEASAYSKQTNRSKVVIAEPLPTYLGYAHEAVNSNL